MHCLFLDCNHFVVKQGEEGSSAVDLETASFIRGKRDSEQQTAEGTAGTATLEKYHKNKHFVQGLREQSLSPQKKTQVNSWWDWKNLTSDH